MLCDFSFLISIKVGKTNKHSLFSQNNWEKAWILQGEPLSLHRVFHSIRFKVNKVGIQWYPIFLFIPQARFLKFLRKSLDFLQKHFRNTPEFYGKNRRFLPIKARLYDLMEEKLKNSAVNLAH